MSRGRWTNMRREAVCLHWINYRGENTTAALFSFGFAYFIVSYLIQMESSFLPPLTIFDPSMGIISTSGSR